MQAPMTADEVRQLMRPTLKAHRTARGLTLRQLAEAAGTKKGYVWEIEDGRVGNPGVKLLAALALGLRMIVSTEVTYEPLDRNT